MCDILWGHCLTFHSKGRLHDLSKVSESAAREAYGTDINTFMKIVMKQKMKHDEGMRHERGRGGRHGAAIRICAAHKDEAPTDGTVSV